MLSRFSEFANAFALMDALRYRMDHTLDDPDASWSGEAMAPRVFASAAFPPINLYDAGTNLVVTADVPGLSAKDVEVTLNGGSLVLSGERRVERPEGYSAHRQERGQIKFSRSLRMPCKVDPEKTTASVKDGVLTVTLAKAAEAQPRQIAVRAQ